MRSLFFEVDMPYIPHTEKDIKEMLSTLNIKSVDTLFEEIPKSVRCSGLKNIPAAMTEMEIARLMYGRAAQDKKGLCFIGAGAYEHYIPAAVWDIAGRGEFATAYTPYQAEASQGTLQVIYEYQSMMCHLMQMDVSNASMYDGASALAESILMAVRAQKGKANTVLLPKALHPAYRQTIKTITKPHNIELIEVPYCDDGGYLRLDVLEKYAENKTIAALVIAQPNFFGALEDVDELTVWAKQRGALVIASVNPLAMALFGAPGSWGEHGADIAVGEGQPLGAPLAYGGPYFGFLCCKNDYLRQLPGRIVGRTQDSDGKEGFVLTMQAREQHIRRAKATSNICSNQALMATAATIYMSLLGFHGMQQVAKCAHSNANLLKGKLAAIKGVKVLFSKRSNFHEFVIQLPKPAAGVIEKLAQLGIQAGYDLSSSYPELGNALLVCVTETKTEADVDFYAKKLEEIL